MIVVEFNRIDKSHRIVESEPLIQGSVDNITLKVMFGTYINSEFVPDITIANDNSKVAGVIFTRSDNKKTWFLPLSRQLDGSFIGVISGWILRKAGELKMDTQIRDIYRDTTEPYARVSFTVFEGSSLEDEVWEFTEADYDFLSNMLLEHESIIAGIEILVGTDFDIMIGTATVYTEEQPLSGLREIDDYQLETDDTVFVAGLGFLNGIYKAQSGAWEKVQEVGTNQVVSIDEGELYGGSQIKKTPDGISLVVKKPERSRWRVRS